MFPKCVPASAMSAQQWARHLRDFIEGQIFDERKKYKDG
jgi:hypothetical protein